MNLLLFTIWSIFCMWFLEYQLFTTYAERVQLFGSNITSMASIVRMGWYIGVSYIILKD